MMDWSTFVKYVTINAMLKRTNNPYEKIVLSSMLKNEGSSDTMEKSMQGMIKQIIEEGLNNEKKNDMIEMLKLLTKKNN